MYQGRSQTQNTNLSFSELIWFSVLRCLCRDLAKMQILNEQVWDGAWDIAFLTSSQVMPRLLKLKSVGIMSQAKSSSWAVQLHGQPCQPVCLCAIWEVSKKACHRGERPSLALGGSHGSQELGPTIYVEYLRWECNVLGSNSLDGSGRKLLRLRNWSSSLLNYWL